MNNKVTKRFTADGSAINVELGFIPDYVLAISKLEETNPDTYEWFKNLADAGANGQYGIKRPSGGGAVTKLSSGNGAITTYDTTSSQVKIPAPNGDGYTVVSASDWTSTLSTAATARSTSAPGTVLRPTSHNGYVYECTSAGTSSGTEPTWPTVPGETVDDGTVTFICREENIVAGGGMGITIGSDLSTDSDEWIVIAEQHDQNFNGGDAASYDPV